MKPARSQILNDISVLAICFFAGAGNYMNAAINTFQEAFPEIEQSVIMLVSTLPSVIAVPSMLLAGRLVGSKVSYKALSILGSVLIVLGGVTPFFVTGSWTFILLCRAMLGVGAGMYGVRNSFIIRSVPPEKIVLMTGLSTVALTVGGSFSGPAVGALASVGWNYAFLYDLVPVIILILVIVGMKEPEKLPEIPKDGAGGKRSAGKLSWKICFYALTQLLIIGTLYPMTVSGVSIYFDRYGLGSPALAGLVMSLFPLLGVVGNLFLNRIMKLFRRFTIPVMAFLVILGAGFSLIFHSLITTAVSYSLAGFGYHVIIGVLQVYNGLEAPPEKLAVGSTLILASKSVGIFLSSYFIMACTWAFDLKNRIGIENAFLGCIIVYALLLLFTVLVRVTPDRKETGRPETPET